MAINKVLLNCKIHGDYRKFQNAEDKQCPSCQIEFLKKKEIEEIQSLKYGGKAFDFEVIVVNCLEHGETELQLPVFVLRNVIECPKCIAKNRKTEIDATAQFYLEAKLLESGIPENTVNSSFSQVDTSKSPRQALMISRFVEYIKDMVKQGSTIDAKNILFSGNMGTGKTLFASILIQNIIKRSVITDVNDSNDIHQKNTLSCQFISEQQFQSAITSTWGNSKTETTEKLIRKLSSKPLLCIDDVGAVSGNHSYLLDAYSELIDERYKLSYPTIFTSNLSYQDLSLAIGVRAADRFLQKEKIIVATFDWNSYRKADENSGQIEFL